MKRKRYTDEQIAYALRQAEAGTPIKEVCRKLGVTETTFYTWRRKFAGMGVAELRELRHLRQENGKLKKLVADLLLDKAHAPGGAVKKGVKPARKRQIVGYLQGGFRVSERRACRLLEFSRTSHRYESVKTDDPVLRRRIRELAAARPRFGYRRLSVLLRRELAALSVALGALLQPL